MLVEHQIVRLRRACEGLAAGSLGVVLQVYAQDEMYLVEFADDGVTIALLDLAEADLAPYRDMIFVAAAVAAEMIDDVFVLAFAENPDASGLSLLLQDGPHDEQDVALGIDTYCICTDSGACHYGGIASARVAEGELLVVLDADAARVLDVDAFNIGFAPDKTDLVRDALERIVARSDNVRAW